MGMANVVVNSVIHGNGGATFRALLAPGSKCGIIISRTVFFCAKWMAGHSQWQNTKYQKRDSDFKKSVRFGKLSLEIITAVKEKGDDPKFNPDLENILSRAKAANMPKTSIANAIKAAHRNSDEQRKKVLMEVRGPGKCGLLLDILTPNASRTRSEIRAILRRNECLVGDGGSVSFMFADKDETILTKTVRKKGKMTDMDTTPHQENPVEDVTLKDVFVQLNSMRRELDSSFTMVNRNMEEMRQEFRRDMINITNMPSQFLL